MAIDGICKKKHCTHRRCFPICSIGGVCLRYVLCIICCILQRLLQNRIGFTIDFGILHRSPAPRLYHTPLHFIAPFSHAGRLRQRHIVILIFLITGVPTLFGIRSRNKRGALLAWRCGWYPFHSKTAIWRLPSLHVGTQVRITLCMIKTESFSSPNPRLSNLRF